MSSALAYGTNGYRTGSLDLLKSVAVRMDAFLVYMGYFKTSPGDADGDGDSAGSTMVHIGAITTTSHNPLGENGIKIVDKYGYMLHAHWLAIV
mmetsp:Transcript_44592/g.87440  ORF Transcript_44592/g.87440 Transcript_44592/m.87440 type:complete len:93 (-) Transcript_44592:1138-1416(-)